MAVNYSFNPYYPNPQYPSGWSTQSYPQQPAQGSNVTWVQGEAGAKAYPVAAGRTEWLFDSEDQVFYIKSTDVNGVPQPLRRFSYYENNEVPIQSKEEAVNFVSREEFDELKKLVEDLTK